MDVELGALEKTLIVPLWHRAQTTKENPELLNDPKAVELINKLNYDFTAFAQRYTVEDSLRSAGRTRQFDELLSAYINSHPFASIVNVGAGLDTAFYRVDNKAVDWYDLDLPRVIALRERLLPEPERVHYIAKSLFDSTWYADIDRTGSGIFLLARGVLWFFAEARVRRFFSSLAGAFPGAELACDACSELGAPIVNSSLNTADMGDIAVQWTIGDARVINEWDSRLQLIAQTPVYSIPHDVMREERTTTHVDPGDRTYALSIIHLKV